MEFQRSVGLKDDGFAGPRTLRALSDRDEPVDAPAPIAAIGHNGGPALTTVAVKADLPAVLASVSKAVGAAKGAAKGASIPGAIALIAERTGWFPAWVFEPAVILAGTLVVTVLMAGAWAAYSAYKAPANS